MRQERLRKQIKNARGQTRKREYVLKRECILNEQNVTSRKACLGQWASFASSGHAKQFSSEQTTPNSSCLLFCHFFVLALWWHQPNLSILRGLTFICNIGTSTEPQNLRFADAFKVTSDDEFLPSDAWFSSLFYLWGGRTETTWGKSRDIMRSNPLC